MKYIHHSIFVFFLLCFLGMNAQKNELDEEAMKAKFQPLIETLNLTEEQKPQFKAISEKYMKAFKELKASDQSRFKKYKTYKELTSKRNAEMQDLLSEKQFEQYLDIQEQIQEAIQEANNK